MRAKGMRPLAGTRVLMATRPIAFVATYVGGLVLLYLHLGGDTPDGFHDLALATAGWSLICGLVTVRFEALLVPVGVIGVWILAAIPASDGTIVLSTETLFFYPVLLGFVSVVLLLPMGAGIAAGRRLQPERTERSQNPLASLDEV